jgi:SAM-dependent methyltransferase
MEGYEPSSYGDRIADIYDELYGDLFDVEATVARLAELAGDGPLLELAIGTGRVALPLAQRGIEVHGVDISEAMVAKLRAKPGSDAVPVTMGNFADVPVEGRYPLIFIAFNTLFALTSQEEQVRCFENVTGALTDDGAFVVEAFVPDVARFEAHQTVRVEDVKLDRARLEVSRHNPVLQTVDSHHVDLSGGSIELYPVSLRYAYPPELDLMARLAGMRLRERWGGWHKEPFGSHSTSHVSVYEKAGVAPE